MTVLVTGATGTVGSAVVTELNPTELPVRAGVRDPTATSLSVETVTFDYTKPETWGDALDGVEAVFLMFPPGVTPGRVTDFADAAVRTGVERLVFLSVLGADKLPVLPHRRIERHLERLDAETAALRVAYFMQNLSGIHSPEIRERGELFVPAGEGRLGFVDARDVGVVAARLLTGERRLDRPAVTLTGPTALNFEEAATVFSAELDREITCPNPSRRAVARRMRDRGLSAGFILFMLAEYQATRFGLTARITDAVAALLGREPRTLAQFVADYRDQFRP
ncbi:NmrA family NAD(P)-binding protein [Halosegnis rubeus]|uniref:NAD(P)H-binding protein n=1 Tax=Halosegnis rubeus TaxID=2212850 RepID=A0A5N5UMH3_9EURY|nr:NmrA family NAD(P)-binding protein [Halosegnis rubeus]KAB7520129.1 NAD(P)H-binding protein [Halosegnis rubeus]